MPGERKERKGACQSARSTAERALRRCASPSHITSQPVTVLEVTAAASASARAQKPSGRSDTRAARRSAAGKRLRIVPTRVDRGTKEKSPPRKRPWSTCFSFDPPTRSRFTKRRAIAVVPEHVDFVANSKPVSLTNSSELASAVRRPAARTWAGAPVAVRLWSSAYAEGFTHPEKGGRGCASSSIRRIQTNTTQQHTMHTRASP